MHGQFLLLKQRVVMNRQKPEQVFRIGAVSGSIFARKIEKAGEPDRIVRSVNLQKRYRDGFKPFADRSSADHSNRHQQIHVGS